MAYIFLMLSNAFSNAYDWFVSIMSYTEGAKVWLSALAVYFSYKFLFAPIFGHAKSDTGLKAYNALKRRKEQ